MNTAELVAALKKADAAASAGDQQAAQDARRLAAALKTAQAQPKAPALDPMHMVKPEARAQVQANQPKRSLPMSPLGPGNERFAPPQPGPQGDPLAPASPEAAKANVDAQQRARGLVPYVNASTGETYWRPDPAKQVAEANAQFKAREAAKATGAKAQGELDAFRASRPDWMNQASDAIRGGFAATENAAFDVVDAGLNVVDPQRKASQFISKNITPVAEQAGRSLGGIIEGPSGRFGGALSPTVGAMTGGLSEFGATLARDPQQGLTEAVDVLEPTHQLARGGNTAGDALSAAITGDYNTAGTKLAESAPDLAAGILGVIPAGSMGVTALRNTINAPSREMAEQLARIPARNAQGRPPVVRGGSGGAPPPVSPGAIATAAPRSRAEQRADDIFMRKLAADGLTVEDLRKIQASLARRGDSGVYETSGEVAALTDKSSGANLRGLQMAGGAAPGPLQEALIGVVNENTRKLPDRLSRGATRATGQSADNAVATLDELEARLRTEATPAYDTAYATPVDSQVFANELLPVLNTPSGQKALQAARNNLASIAADLQGRAARGASERATMEAQRAQAAVKSIDDFMADPVRGTAIPTTMALDYTKRAFDDVIADAGFGSDTARIVGGTKRNFADSVSQATGGQYGNALGVFEDVKRLEDAFEVGLKALNKPTWELTRDMKKGRSGSAWTAGEVEAIAMGVARNIEDLIEANNQSALTKLLKDKALKNMATALGSEKAAEMFEQTIRRLGANREWGRRVAGGSDTAMRQAAIRDAGMEGEDAITRVLDRVETSGNQFSLPGLVNDVAVKPIARTAKDIYQRLRYPGVYDEEVNRALIPLIGTPMTKGNLDEVIRRVEARMAEKGKGRPTAASQSATPQPKALPGQKSSSPAALGGAALGGVLGAMAPADDENEQLMNALFGAGIGGVTVGGAAKLMDGGGKPPKGQTPKPAGAWKRDPATVGLGTQDYLAYINAKHPPATPNQTPPYFIAASTLKRAGGDRQAAQAELADYAAYLRRSKAAPEVVENADRAAKAVADVDPMFFDDAAFNARMRSEITAGGEGAMAAVRGSTPDDGISGSMRAERGDMLPGERPIKRATPKPPPVKNGFGGKSLPMDEASRMQRAREQGFDVERVAYRGLGRAYDESGKGGGRRYQMFTSSESDAAEYGSNVVAAYLRKGNNLQVDGGRRNFNSVSVSQLPDDVRAKLHPSIQGVARIDDIADAAQKAGYDSVTVANVFDNAWGEIPTKPTPTKPRQLTQKEIDLDNELLRELGFDPADFPSTPRTPDAPEAPAKNTDPVTIDVVFDTKNIRSPNAKFDPSETQSSKLLAGVRGQPEAIGAGLGTVFAPDADGDGEVSFGERAGAAITGGVMGRGARAIGNRAKPKQTPADNISRAIMGDTPAPTQAKSPDPDAMTAAIMSDGKSALRSLGIGRSLGGAIAGGLAGAIVGEAGGQDAPLVNEFLEPLTQERERIKKLEAELNIIENGTVEEKQKYLAETRGLKISADGTPDGKLGPDTRAAIAKARTELEADINARRDREKDIAGKAEDRRAEIEMKGAFDRTKPDGAVELARELGPWVGIGAGILASTLMRKSAVKKTAAESAKKAASLNKLVSGETPMAPVTVYSRKELGKRATNLNEFFYQGGAGKPDNLKQRLGLEPKKGVPLMPDDNGDWMASPNAKNAFDLFKPGTKHFKMMDVAVIGAAMAESEFAGTLAKDFHRQAVEAQAAVDKAQEDGNAANLEIAMARLESAKNAEAAAIAFQRFGQVAALARTAGAFKMPYEYTRPNVKKAQADQALILDAIRRAREAP